jgi:Response regulator containing a CheY-like receiver domain and an HTH DNA-binding domain
MLDTLQEYFPHYIFSFFTPYHRDFFIDKEYNTYNEYRKSVFFYPLRTISKISVINADNIRRYQNIFLYSDPEQPANLPESLIDRIVLTRSDIENVTDTMDDGIYRFMETIGVKHKASIYLKHFDTYIGGLGVMRSDKEGPFTDDDIHVLELLGRSISAQYYEYLQSVYNVSITNAYRSYINHHSVGCAIFSENLSIIEANSSAYSYAEEIVKATNAEHAVNAANYLPNLLSLITHSMTGNSIENTSDAIFASADYEYRCSIISCLMNSMDLKSLYTLYCLRIERSSRGTFTIPGYVINKYDLTKRESEIASLLVKGLSTDQIAHTLFISHNTARNHISNIYRKFGVSSRVDLILKLKSE